MDEVSWTPEAERRLRSIHDYLAEDDPAAALRIVEGIYRKAEALAQFPEIGYQYPRETEQPVWVQLCGHYRIAYSVLPNRDVDILGVYDGALEIERFLGQSDSRP